MTILDHGTPITLAAMKQNQIWRTQQQATLTKNYRMDVLLTIRLIIPGNVKNNEALRRVFIAGLKELELICSKEQLPIIYFENYLHRLTGPEAFLILSESSVLIKRRMVRFEDQFTLGCLFKIDIWPYGSDKCLSRTDVGRRQRQCLICSQPAKKCCREQKHSLEQLKLAVDQRYWAYFG